MSFHNEPDTCQCQSLTDTKKRCTRIATHSNGGKVLCERHHQMHLAKKANDVPIVRKK